MDELDQLLFDLQGSSAKPANQAPYQQGPYAPDASQSPASNSSSRHTSPVNGNFPQLQSDMPAGTRGTVANRPDDGPHVERTPSAVSISGAADLARRASSRRVPSSFQQKQSQSHMQIQVQPVPEANSGWQKGSVPETSSSSPKLGSSSPRSAYFQRKTSGSQFVSAYNAQAGLPSPPALRDSGGLHSPTRSSNPALDMNASEHILSDGQMAALAAVSSVEAAALSSLSKPVQLPAKAPLPSPSPFTPPAAAGSGTRSDRICAVCDQPIVRGGAGLRGKFYHTEHFVCSDPTCKRALRGQVTFEKNDQLFCEKCYHNNFSPKCAYCREPIKDNIIEALGLTFHRAHFFCSQCGRTFGPDDMFREFEGKAYCEDDYAALFADRCAACHQPMLDNSVSALDRQWHSTCFVCADPACNTMLTAEGFYEYQGRPYCELHYYHQTDNICDVCKKPIIGRCVVALDRKFHPRHFTCSFCQTELDGSAGQGYKERSGKPYCGNCYIKLFC